MSPVFDLKCQECGVVEPDTFVQTGSEWPEHCGQPMKRLWSGDFQLLFPYSPPLWVGRMDDIHKAQEQRGERLRFVSPAEIGAT